MTTPQHVRLTRCSDAEYGDFAALQVIEYADQLVRAGEIAPQDALVTARERLDDLVMDRLRTTGHTFFSATSPADKVRVGWVWISPPPSMIGVGHERTCWLSQLTVEERLRRRGWGRAILAAIDAHVAAAGIEEIWLRVFNWNVAAVRLYESHGYERVTQFAVDAHLRKQLPR